VRTPTVPIAQDNTRFSTRLDHSPILKPSYQIRNVPNNVRISDYQTRRHHDGPSTADPRTDAAAGSANKKQIRSSCPSWKFRSSLFFRVPRGSSPIPPVSPPSWILAQCISILPLGLMLTSAKEPGSEDGGGLLTRDFPLGRYRSTTTKEESRNRIVAYW
jgi:hypothetical protein